MVDSICRSSDLEIIGLARNLVFYDLCFLHSHHIKGIEFRSIDKTTYM